MCVESWGPLSLERAAPERCVITAGRTAPGARRNGAHDGRCDGEKTPPQSRGPYEVELRDSSAMSKASPRGDAYVRNQVSTLEVALDLAPLSGGAYQIALRRHREDWQLFPVQAQ